MFIKIGTVNYFIITEGKSAQQVFDELYPRMNKVLSYTEKQKTIASIARQMKG